MSTIWDNLCVMEEIARHIKSPEDFTAFGGVCKLSRSAATEQNFNFKSTLIPWLMLPPKPETIKSTHIRNFFGLSKGMYKPINLPEAKNKRCYSSKGWLFMVDKALNISLLHPIFNTRIDLPNITTVNIQAGWDWTEDDVWPSWDESDMWYAQIDSIYKFVLSGTPGTSDYTVLVLFWGLTREVAYFRPGFESWVKIDTFKGCCDDAVFCQGKFYAINTKREVFGIDIKTDFSFVCEKVAQVSFARRVYNSKECIPRLYLGDLDGKLLVIRKLIERADDEDDEEDGDGDVIRSGTCGCEVFELDLKNGENLIKINDLGSMSIFLGYNCSVAVEVCEVSNVLNPNCVYFTEDEPDLDDYATPPEEGVPIPPRSKNGGQDIGFCKLDGTVERIFMPDWCFYDQRSPLIWVEQSLLCV